MSERISFAEHFIQSQCQIAARAMEELPADVLGSFIEAITDSLSVTALTSMMPYHAAKCLESITPAAAAEYLTQLNPRNAAAILRHSGERERKTVMNLLPRRQALVISLTLHYPQGLVGAWMDPGVLSLPVEITVAEAKKRISPQNYNYSLIFTVDGDNRILGSINLADVLQHSNEAALISGLELHEVNWIFASATLNQAINDEGWAHSEVLPVVDREEKFVGVVRFVDLLQVENKPNSANAPDSTENDFLNIAEFCYLSLAKLVSISLADERRTT